MRQYPSKYFDRKLTLFEKKPLLSLYMRKIRLLHKRFEEEGEDSKRKILDEVENTKKLACLEARVDDFGEILKSYEEFRALQNTL